MASSLSGAAAGVECVCCVLLVVVVVVVLGGLKCGNSDATSVECEGEAVVDAGFVLVTSDARFARGADMLTS